MSLVTHETENGLHHALSDGVQTSMVLQPQYDLSKIHTDQVTPVYHQIPEMYQAHLEVLETAEEEDPLLHGEEDMEAAMIYEIQETVNSLGETPIETFRGAILTADHRLLVAIARGRLLQETSEMLGIQETCHLAHWI